MSGARGVPRGRDRVLSDDGLPAFKAKVDALRAEGLSLSLVGERLGIPASPIISRLARLKRLEEKL